jgi:universal stress protein A
MNLTFDKPLHIVSEQPTTELAKADLVKRHRLAPASRIQKIVVATDFSETAKAALDYAIFMARVHGATLKLVHSVEPYVYPEDLSAGYTIDELDGRWIQKHTEKLEALRRTLPPSLKSSTMVTMGTPWHQIVEIAKKWEADLIVIGTHGRTGVKHALMGSTAERVARHAACPVLVVHDGSNKS